MTPDRGDVVAFISESNRIENIVRSPTREEIEEALRFLELRVVTVGELEKFVSVYQPDARLRREYGHNVRVGTHVAPAGGPDIETHLELLLKNLVHPFLMHVAYETLHPFSDGNGRSGRMLWAWQMIREMRWPGLRLGFLHAWYYQSLEFSRRA